MTNEIIVSFQPDSTRIGTDFDCVFVSEFLSQIANIHQISVSRVQCKRARDF